MFQVDAFGTRLFEGNPAAVVCLERVPSDSIMQAVAAENNLSETAFLVPAGDDYRLRWFTPKLEVPLCGHATLANAAVVMERLAQTRKSVLFHTLSGRPVWFDVSVVMNWICPRGLRFPSRSDTCQKFWRMINHPGPLQHSV